MNVVDIVLLSAIGVFALFGLWFGFVHTLGSLLGTVFGAYLATRYYGPFADILFGLTGWEGNLPRVIIFAISFLIINRLVGLVFWVIDKALSIVTRLPFVGSLNHILGLLLGVAEGAVSIGLIIFFIERFPLSLPFMEHLADSQVAPYLSAIAAILWPLLPDALRLLQSTVDYLTHAVL
jgi:membrane protein required for colicin V production